MGDFIISFCDTLLCCNVIKGSNGKDALKFAPGRLCAALLCMCLGAVIPTAVTIKRLRLGGQ